MVPDENEEAEQLILRRKELTNLEGINFAQYAGLRVLSVSHNNLVDISPICQLPTLEELNVNQNQLTDLSPAVQCPALRVLLAAKNQVHAQRHTKGAILGRWFCFSGGGQQGL